jgi:hypothetical protein
MAERQARRQVEALRHSGALDTSGTRGPNARRAAIAQGEPISIDEMEDNFVVATDVSFPVEVQLGDALADQLRKLNQLLEQGILTAEEYAVAKTKILS